MNSNGNSNSPYNQAGTSSGVVRIRRRMGVGAGPASTAGTTLSTDGRRASSASASQDDRSSSERKDSESSSLRQDERSASASKYVSANQDSGSVSQAADGNTTLQAGAWKSRVTIPFVGGLNGAAVYSHESSIEYHAGDKIGRYTLTRFLCDGAVSRLFLGESRHGERVTVKFYEPGIKKTSPALRKLGDVIRTRGCASLMPLISYGDLENGIHYEVMPVYQQGTLENEKLSEKEILNKILPQLNDALTILGENHLVHNDIKPANIFWRDRTKREIALGDYDCVTFDKDEPAGGTPLYMAPERIFTDGVTHTNASDYCSLGLTLITLLQGKALLEDMVTEDLQKQKQHLYRRWQRQVQCPTVLPVSPKMRGLLDRLISFAPDIRYGGSYIASWIENDGLGVRTYHEKVQKKVIKGLRYQGKMILDIPELLQALGNEWEFGTFMLKQHKLEDFVRQFNGDFYRSCLQFASLYDSSAGLFKLMQTISPSQDFYWLGEHYESMEDFADQTEKEEKYGIKDPFCYFCRMELISFYESVNGGDERQIERAKEIEQAGRRNPELAVRQLQISMHEKPDYIWHGTTFLSLKDLMDHFESHVETLDDDVSEFTQSKAAKVWLDYIGEGTLLAEFQKQLLENGL